MQSIQPVSNNRLCALKRYGIAGIIVMLLLNFNACQSISLKHPQTPALNIEKEKLTTHMSAMVHLQPPRNAMHIQSLDKAADYIKKQFEKFGYLVDRQSYTVSQNQYHNIVASYLPTQPNRLIVGAHYDVYGEQQGADDNASGITGLLILAELLQKQKPNLNYGVDFVAYTLEEPPYFKTQWMGSFQHANRLKENDIQVIGMISLEMIGYFSERPNSQSYPLSIMKWFYPTRGNFIAVVGNFASGKLIKHVKKHMRMAAIEVESLKAPSFITGVDFSDHLNYWKHGYSAVMITDTSFYRYRHYHTPEDTMDKINFDKMVEVIRGVYFAMINLNIRN